MAESTASRELELVAQFTRCAECGLTLLEEESVVPVEGEWYHEQCAYAVVMGWRAPRV